MEHFGHHTRLLRERYRQANNRYSIRQTALRVGLAPGYLSRIERGNALPPSEDAIRRLAADLGEDFDYLLALAGKISSDVREIIMRRPVLFTELIRCLNDVPDHELAKLVSRIRNGDWAENR
ncbi:MAG: XRE family transcriptional regulator [Candidatus Competibacteraceae bacterium]|nr:MAG: XRE family transcriptional regulator [Candidatus Competibacteraceae bacterium]